MSEEVKLLPCPFCGGIATTYRDDNSDYKTHWSYGVQCNTWRTDEKRCPGVAVDGFATEKEAIAFWNTRASGGRDE